MSDDWDYDFESRCPKCGHEPTKWRHCDEIGCDDGYVDMYEYDDPLWYEPGDIEMCPECHGTGIIRWCPQCGHDLNSPVGSGARGSPWDGTGVEVRDG